MLELTLPWPPSVNTYWRSVTIHGHPRVLISEKGREYRKEVAWSLTGLKKIHGPVRVEVECWMPDKRKRDLDNLFKAIGDSLTHAGIWDDDSQVDDLRIYRARENGNLLIGGMVKIRIEPLGQGTQDLAA